MKTLYFDCFAGASGNMILAALVALGAEKDELVRQINLLNISDFEIEFKTVDKSGISALYAEVKIAPEKAHRHLYQIEKIIDDSQLNDSIKKRAAQIFRKLAAAEAKIHGIEIEKVHFHEVGAMDAIIDVVGACIGFDLLGIEKFVCSKIHVGSGFVKMAHGKFPVPPPAVAELLQNVPVYSTEIEGELMTPTGAAIISAVCGEFGNLPELTVEKTAYGAGSRDYKDFPNVLRLMLGETQGSKFKVQNAKLLLIETNLDDTSPEILGYVMDKAFEIGALDCWFTPIQMKKNRPGVMISVLCQTEMQDKFMTMLVQETPTLGVRLREIERTCLAREVSLVNTKFGEIPVKIARLGEKIVNIKPEFEKLKEIARRENLPLREVESEVLKKL